MQVNFYRKIKQKKSAGKAAGHACGHHLFGTASTAAAIAVKDQSQTISHGVVVVATGGQEHTPTEYLYGRHPGVITQKEFEDRLKSDPDTARKLPSERDLAEMLMRRHISGARRNIEKHLKDLS